MTEYDKVQRKITYPIKEAVKGLDNLIFGKARENKIQKSISDIADSLQLCHNSIHRINDDVIKDVHGIVQFNVIQDVKVALDVILETTSFIQDVSSDVDIFYKVCHDIYNTQICNYTETVQM
jgi:hypothetical protein